MTFINTKSPKIPTHTIHTIITSPPNKPQTPLNTAIFSISRHAGGASPYQASSPSSSPHRPSYDQDAHCLRLLAIYCQSPFPFHIPKQEQMGDGESTYTNMIIPILAIQQVRFGDLVLRGPPSVLGTDSRRRDDVACSTTLMLLLILGVCKRERETYAAGVVAFRRVAYYAFADYAGVLVSRCGG